MEAGSSREIGERKGGWVVRADREGCMCDMYVCMYSLPFLLFSPLLFFFLSFSLLSLDMIVSRM